jgi:hypothetical protein
LGVSKFAGGRYLHAVRALLEELDRDIPTIVGIDHAFSFPLAYFETYRLPSD